MPTSMMELRGLQQHAKFFDHLVELIPARFYLTDGEERVDLRTMKKAARMAMKQEFKAKSKENKRNKLNPDAPATALEIQQLQVATKADGMANGGGAHGGGVPSAGALNLSAGSLSREELKARLHKKIEAIQQQRNQKDKEAVAQQAKDWRNKTLESSVKQKQKQKQEQQDKQEGQAQQAGSKRKADGAPAGDAAAAAKKQARKAAPGSKQQQPQVQEQEGQATQASQQAANGKEGDFQFARVQFGDTKPQHGRGKKPTKEQLLKQAEAKQAQIAAVKDTSEGRVQVMTDAWKTALARAGGEKVLDDPKLLKKSMKKEAKRKEKSAKVWQERKASQQEQQDKRQQRRQDNLKARVDKKIETKKEKREKKLLRAGFEGRKAGFIGAGGAGGKPTAGKK